MTTTFIIGATNIRIVLAQKKGAKNGSTHLKRKFKTSTNVKNGRPIRV